MENKTPGVLAIAVCFQAFHFEYPKLDQGIQHTLNYFWSKFEEIITFH